MRLKIARQHLGLNFSPYVYYLLDKALSRTINLRSIQLNRLITLGKYDFVHALEFQSAGYLIAESWPNRPTNSQLLVTNWGSDIYFFQDIQNHRQMITKVLKLAHLYSAECQRDYELASGLGFNGRFLPLIPNSFKSSRDFNFNAVLNPEVRSQVIVKAYGEKFGLGSITLRVIEELLNKDPRLMGLAYSVTPDLISSAKKLENQFGFRFRYHTVSNPISHTDLMAQFAVSRIYIGASRSDGISTSFLEALDMGAYPIQTNTSCAAEWLDKGAIGSVVNINFEEILNEASRVINDFELLSMAQISNSRIVQEFLSSELIKKISISFYSAD